VRMISRYSLRVCVLKRVRVGSVEATTLRTPPIASSAE